MQHAPRLGASPAVPQPALLQVQRLGLYVGARGSPALSAGEKERESSRACVAVVADESDDSDDSDEYEEFTDDSDAEYETDSGDDDDEEEEEDEKTKKAAKKKGKGGKKSRSKRADSNRSGGDGPPVCFSRTALPLFQPL